MFLLNDYCVNVLEIIHQITKQVTIKAVTMLIFYESRHVNTSIQAPILFKINFAVEQTIQPSIVMSLVLFKNFTTPVSNMNKSTMQLTSLELKRSSFCKTKAFREWDYNSIMLN